MNPTFNTSRLLCLFRKFYAEHSRITYWGYGIVLFLSLFIFASNKSHDAHIYIYSYSYINILLCCWILATTTTTLKYYLARPYSDSVATLPASKQEKFAFLWLRTYPVALVEFLLLVCTAATVFNLTGDCKVVFASMLENIGATLIPLTFLHALVLLGKQYSLARNDEFKLVHNILLLIGFFTLYLLLINFNTFNDVTFYQLLGPAKSCYTLSDKDTWLDLWLKYPHNDAIAHTILLLQTLLLWVAGYFKYIEKEFK